MEDLVSVSIDNQTEQHSATSFDEFRDILKHLQGAPTWNNRLIYRGHAKAEYRLMPTLDRIVEKINKRPREATTGGTGLIHTRKSAEGWFLTEFRRAVHHHHQVAIKDDDILGWLALMQHHGSPTRLLDWTLSPYVALHFAVQPAEQECAVWVYNPPMLHEVLAGVEDWTNAIAEHQMGLMRDQVEKLKTLNGDIEIKHEAINIMLRLGIGEKLLVAPAVRPFQLNLRVSAQQAVFVLPLASEMPFEKCLLQTMLRSRAPGAILNKITIKDHDRDHIMRELQRMNITNETLFPGLDGYAKSLADRYELDMWVPSEQEPIR
jgi:hypothetical protein